MVAFLRMNEGHCWLCWLNSTWQIQAFSAEHLLLNNTMNTLRLSTLHFHKLCKFVQLSLFLFHTHFLSPLVVTHLSRFHCWLYWINVSQLLWKYCLGHLGGSVQLLISFILGHDVRVVGSSLGLDSTLSMEPAWDSFPPSPPQCICLHSLSSREVSDPASTSDCAVYSPMAGRLSLDRSLRDSSSCWQNGFGESPHPDHMPQRCTSLAWNAPLASLGHQEDI